MRFSDEQEKRGGKEVIAVGVEKWKMKTLYRGLAAGQSKIGGHQIR